MESQAPFSFFMTMMFLVLLIVITVICRMMIFEKAGRSNVSAFIPFLNFYVMLQIVGMKRICTFLYFITLLNIFVSIRSLMPLLMPDEVWTSTFSIPYIHPKSKYLLPVLYACLNAVYLFVYIRLHLSLAERFGKSRLFGLAMAFLEPVFYPILAFGKASFRL
jgi:hypothetical protein